MFGMSFGEILIIAVIAILFLGPDKLPDAMVKVAKFFKSFKRSINDVKDTFEHEMQLQELREDALTYKDKIQNAAGEIKNKANFDFVDDIKEGTKELSDSLTKLDTDDKPSKTKKDTTEKGSQNA